MAAAAAAASSNESTKRAVLVGLQYPDEKSLKAQWNNVHLYADMTKQLGFPPENVVVITDEHQTVSPETIMDQLERVLAECENGDLTTLYFSGYTGSTVDGETTFYTGHGASIPGKYLKEIVTKLGKKSELTIVLDMSYPGGLMDKELVDNHPADGTGIVIFLSCAPNQESMNIATEDGFTFGAFTLFMTKFVNECDDIIIEDLHTKIKTSMDDFIDKENEKKWAKKKEEMLEDLLYLLFSKKKKNAVLIGLNHPDPQMNAIDTKGQILRMKKHLMELRGFPESKITLMTEDSDVEGNIPTIDNIKATLSSLVESANPGDILFIHLIAYGCVEGVIITADKQHMPDSYFRAIIMKAVKKGCKLTFVSDCLIEPAAECSCPKIPRPVINWEEQLKKMKEVYSNECLSRAKLVNWEYSYSTPTKLSSVDILNPKVEQKTEDDDDSSGVVLLTSFLSHTSAKEDVSELLLPPPTGTTKTSYGGFTNAILEVVEETHGEVTNLDLARKAIEKHGAIPGLSCGHHRHAYASFVC